MVGTILILALGIFLFSRGGVQEPTIKGQFTPEEIRQIERTVRHDRWSIMRSLVSSHRFRLAFEVFVADMAFGSIDEIGPDSVMTVGLGGSITNSMGAYLITRGSCLKKIVKYELERTNTGLKVAVVVFPTMKASKP